MFPAWLARPSEEEEDNFCRYHRYVVRSCAVEHLCGRFVTWTKQHARLHPVQDVVGTNNNL